jgi:hypothetical protein
MKPKLVRKEEPAFFVRLSDGTSEQGPLRLDDLRGMARAGTLTPDDVFRREGEEEFRPLSSDAALVADLWPEDEPFDPTALQPQTARTPVEKTSEQGFDSAGLLQENVERDRRAKAASGIEDTPPKVRPPWGLIIRWSLAVVLFGGLWFVWRDTGRFAPGDALVIGWSLAIVIAILIGMDLVKLAAAPVNGLITTLFEGTGGGAGADYWTADSLVQQGELKLALSEYRKIVLHHPRELQAYLQGFRIAKSLGDEKEADRFHALALKNLRSDQDRNLFLSSVERM